MPYMSKNFPVGLKVLIFLLVVLQPFFPLAFAQKQERNHVYAKPERVVIKDIKVSGVRYLDTDVLISLSGLRRGDTIDLPGLEITQAVKKLRSQNLFSDVAILVDSQEDDGVVLNLNLTEQPRVSKIIYEGAKRSARDDFKETLPLRLGQQATPSTIESATRVISKYYKDKGYLFVNVDTRQEPDTALLNAVQVIFRIKRGKKVKIKEIKFEGNKAFTDRKLRRKAFKECKQLSWNFFQNHKFVQTKLDKDLANIIDFYNEHGYRDAKVLADSVYRISNKRVGIKVDLYEGNQYHIRSIKWVGNTVFPSGYLDRLLGMKRGDIYDKALIEKRLHTDDNSISTLYMDDGYLFFNIFPVEVNVSHDSVSLEIRLMEGPQATISAVEITGNTRTNEKVIRRELRTNPGDLFSRTNAMRSLRELAQLGFFDPEALSRNGLKPVPNPQDGTVVLKYHVEENRNDQLEFSAGWGGGMFVGSVGVRFSNFSASRLFDASAWDPIPAGDGQSLAIKGTTNGNQYKSLSISFTDAWLGGYKPNNLSVSFFYSVYDYSKYIWNPSEDYFKVTGGAIGLGTRLKWPDDYFTLYSEVACQNYTLHDWNQDFIFRNGSANNLSLKLVFGRNSVDQLIYPRSGSSFSISVQATPPYSMMNGKDYSSPSMTSQERYRWIEYHKWTARAQWYTRLVGDLVLYFNAQFGVLGRYQNDVGYSPFEGFDLGGDGLSNLNFMYGRDAIGLRGYSNGSLTPRLPNNVRMANIYDKFTTELRFPIVLKPQSSVYILGFVEAGNAFYEINSFNPFQLYQSAGVGFRVFLPFLGMLGFDLGYGFNKVPWNSGANGWQPHFVVGLPM